jgi:hypothetical protein
MIKNVIGDGFIQTNKMDVYGGIDLYVSMNPMYKESLDWLVKFKQEHEQEQLLRETNQAVKNAWEQYQIMKILAKKERQDVI